jgi:large conductance mechanosensitive channel
MNKLKERRERGKEPGPADQTDVELLKEIRDLLAAQQQRSHQ